MRVRVSAQAVFWNVLLPFLLGGGNTFAFAPYYNWPLTISVYAVLYGLVRRVRGRTGAVFSVGFSFGAGLFLVGGGWFFECVKEYYVSHWLHAAALMALFTTVMSGAHAGLPLALADSLEKTCCSGRRVHVLSFAVWITLADWFRCWLFTGFSWFEPGYSHSWPSPLASLLPYGGVHLVTLVSLLFSALAFELAHDLYHCRRSGYQGIAVWAASIALLAAGLASVPVFRLAEREDSISARLVQGNVNKRLLDERVLVAESIATYLPAVDDSRHDLIVLPEGAFPDNLAAPASNVLRQAEAATARNRNTVLFGSYLYGATGVWNAAIAISGGQVQSYRKRHLIPFAEYTPFLFKSFVTNKRQRWGEFAPGNPEQEPLTVGKDAAAVSICYEAMFGEEFSYAAPRATFLVSVNNLVWLGTRAALDQHLQLNQVRAAEYGKPMLQVSNTGLTAHIDGAGRVLASTGSSEAAELQVRFKGAVGASWYARTGNIPVLLIIFGFLAYRLCSNRWQPVPAPRLLQELSG